MPTYYSIAPKKEPRGKGDKFPFRLWNGDAPVGCRLFKGNTSKNPFPLQPNMDTIKDFGGDCPWNRYPTMADAFQAAELLQEYLERSELLRDRGS